MGGRGSGARLYMHRKPKRLKKRLASSPATAAHLLAAGLLAPLPPADRVAVAPCCIFSTEHNALCSRGCCGGTRMFELNFGSKMSEVDNLYPPHDEVKKLLSSWSCWLVIQFWTHMQNVTGIV
jgi:hypothetical protein